MALVGAVLGQAESFTQARQRLLASPQLAGTQHGGHSADQGFIFRCLAEYVEATADGDVLNLAKPAVDMHKHVIEDLLVRTLVPTEVAVHLRGGQQRPNLLTDSRQLGRIHGGDVLVLVEKLLQTGDVAVRLGAGHRRNEVVD